MAAAWPEYARIEADGYGLGQAPDVARTAFDDGLVRQEKLYTAAPALRRITALLDSDADLARFLPWAAEYAHRLFTWTDPEDGVAREVRVRGGAGGIAYRAKVSGGRRRWELSCEIEGHGGHTIQTGE